MAMSYRNDEATNGQWRGDVLKILIVDDSPEDRALIRFHLHNAYSMRCEILEASTGRQALKLCAEEKPDCVLLDWRLPDMECQAALQSLSEGEGECLVPVVVLTGMDEDVAALALRAGAQDYIGKDLITAQSLSRAIHHSVERFALLRQLRKERRRLELVSEAVNEGIWDLYVPDGLVYRNDQWAKMLGYAPSEISASLSTWKALLHMEDRPKALQAFEDHLAGRTAEYVSEHRLRRRDGSWAWVQDRGRVVERDETGKALRVVGAQTDVDARRRVEESLRQLKNALERRIEKRSNELAEERAFSRSVIETSQTCISAYDSDLRIRIWNHASEKAFGVNAADALGRNVFEVLPSFRETGNESAMRAALRGQTVSQEFNFSSPDAELNGIYEAVYAPLRDLSGGRVTGLLAFFIEVTEHKALEAQLRQVYKMEAIGQLAGGVAHDFNNLLQAIIGQLTMIERRSANDEIKPLATSAIRSAMRAAKLTQQLLAFSRQQTLEPQTVEVGKLLNGMSELLRRSLGEQIEIDTISPSDLWLIFVDPNQLENAILNIAVNARDAMPRGGKLTLETSKVFLDEDYAASHADVTAGEYVMISIADTGTGMSKRVLEKMFDPFFTTKEPNRGTGLGLSMVYGFVKQSKGHINVRSELGGGTTIRIFLPRCSASLAETAKAPSRPPETTSAHEIILVVEDDDDVRAFTCDALKELGYRVLEAPDGIAAIGVLNENPDVSVVLVDVGLPGGLTGRALADAARWRRPAIKILFTTGYMQNAVVQDGAIDASIQVLMKPFTLNQLAAKIHEVLSPEAPKETGS
jgi:PAS domain S-box-containing protein